jgi:hypothetical protein
VTQAEASGKGGWRQAGGMDFKRDFNAQRHRSLTRHTARYTHIVLAQLADDPTTDLLEYVCNVSLSDRGTDDSMDLCRQFL